MTEAADRIEQLEAENGRLRAALQRIADWGEVDEAAQWGIEHARIALRFERANFKVG
jgi:hypothetical protein